MMSCIKLTGSPARLSHKMHAYAVASLCGASRAIQSGDVARWAALMNDAARFFGTAASCERMEARFGLPADPSAIEVDISALTDAELTELTRQQGAHQ